MEPIDQEGKQVLKQIGKEVLAMQDRMKKHQLSAEQIDQLLLSAQVGHIGTNNENGFPYVLPVHYIYEENTIYVHGLSLGQKLSNIKRDQRVCFQVEEMKGLVMSDEACDVNTEYESVVILGQAEMVEDKEKKLDILHKVIAKYAPSLIGQKLPGNMVNGTGVIKITPVETTGKYFK